MIKVVELPIDKDMGGLTSYVLQLYSYIDKKEFDLMLLTYDDIACFDDLNNVMKVDRPYRTWSFYKSMKRLVKLNYDIIHFHQSYVNIVPILLAKLAGFNNIILHAHSSSIDDNRTLIRYLKTILHKIGKFFIPFIVDTYIGCSQKASIWMFSDKCINGDSYYLFNNSIDLDEYNKDHNKYIEMRQKLNLPKDALVVGHIGRFTPVKNHSFIISMFRKLLEMNSNSYLLLLGDGIERKKIELLVNEQGIESNVIFMGYVSNPVEIMQTMDVIVLPSLFEGMPLVAIESQALGIPILLSDRITNEVAITELCNFLSIDDELIWVNKILEKSHINNTCDYKNQIKAAGYDLKETIKSVEQLYRRYYGF